MGSVVRLRQPELIVVNNRQVTSHGMFNADLMANYVNENGRDDWLPIGELARVAYGQNVKSSQARTRKALPKLFRALFDRSELLLYKHDSRTNGHNRIEAVKIFDNTLASDRQAAEEKLKQIRQRKNLTAEQYARIRRMVGLITVSVLD